MRATARVGPRASEGEAQDGPSTKAEYHLDGVTVGGRKLSDQEQIPNYDLSAARRFSRMRSPIAAPIKPWRSLSSRLTAAAALRALRR